MYIQETCPAGVLDMKCQTCFKVLLNCTTIYMKIDITALYITFFTPHSAQVTARV